jgi:HK97 gp10 family phage protein
VADSIRASVSGVDALNRELARVAGELGKRALPPSLAAAANVIASAVQRGAEPHSITGKMAAALEIKTELDSSGQRGEADIGFGDQSGVAMHVEYGHREITAAGADAGHVPAHPFIRPAFDSSKGEAVDAFAATFADQAATVFKG